MSRMPISLIKGDKMSSRTEYGDRLSVNMYPVEKKILGVDGYMQCYPGLSSFGTAVSADRAGVYNERFSKHFRVSGDKFISVDEVGAVTNLGTVTGLTQCRLIDFYSFNTQGIIADEKFYLYDSVGGFVNIPDGDGAIDGVWINGYYFMTDGEYLFHTNITDETIVDALQYQTAEFSPDPILGVGRTQDNKVMAFGRYTIEYFKDVASENFAFTRVESRAQKIGIVATHAKCESELNWYIIGGRKEEALSVHMVGIGQSQKIATKEIDQVIRNYTEPELKDIRVESRQLDDTTFILFHLPNETLCFNATVARSRGINSAWAILRSGLLITEDYRAINGISDPRINEWIYGDKTTSMLGILDTTLFTHYDARVQWEMYSPLVRLETLSIDELAVETLPGFNDYGDATVAVSLTYDGITFGHEWFNLYGETAKYNLRFILRRLGYVGDFVGFKFRGATKSRMAFGLCTLEVS